jgi:hypothetical protein
MQDVSVWAQEMSISAANLAGRVIEYLPTILGALLVILAGWLIARLVRSALVRSARWLNNVMARRLAPEHARHLHVSNTGIKLIGNIAFWVIILFFVTAASRVLGLYEFTSWLDSIVGYLPTFFAGCLIILFGFLISALARDITTAAVASAGIAQAELFGRALQAAILVTTLVLGISQIGIDVTLLVTLIAILAAAIAGSLALAFALGARSLVGNLIGAHYLQQHYRTGQHARMGDVEGEILEFTPVSVVLATEQGRVTVPAKVFNDQVTSVVAEAPANE